VAERSFPSTQIDLRALPGPELRLDREFAPAEIPQDPEDFRVATPVRLIGRLRKHDDRYRLEGQIRAGLELPCGRCLEPYGLPVAVDVDLTYVPQPVGTGPADEEREVAEDDLSTSYYRDQVLDLGEMVREQFYLALPMRPLCREDCRGLCPECGTNRNTGRCDCAPRWEDSRLAGLKALVDKRTRE
jgi:uncharacterized protein